MHQPPKQELSGRFTFLPIEDVFYGSGSVANLAAVLQAHGVNRALLVTGTTLATQTDLVGRVQEAAEGRIAGVFHDTIQHVHRQSVLRATETARELDADGVVTFGGGTPNDSGKAVVLALAEGVKAPEDFDARRVRYAPPDRVEVPPIQGDAVPLVAVSTTLSAGEFTHVAGITDEVRRVKDLYLDRKMTARSVILDPDLTVATPGWLWLSTGMRSVDHCVEALCSTSAHPYADALALRALAMLDRFLRECQQDPGDLVARGNAQAAAWMSIASLANVSLGLSHGIGHQLGARNDVPHGITSCVMLHPTMTWNKEHTGERQAWIAEAMGVDTTHMSTEEAAAAGRDAVLRLIQDLGLPYRLRDVGVTREDFPALARDALEDLVVATNPRLVSSEADVMEVLELAY